MSKVKKIKFVEKSMKAYPCDTCCMTIEKGSSYFNFEEIKGDMAYGHVQSVDHKKVCFDCYPVEQKHFRKNRDISSLKAEVRNINNTVDSLRDTIVSVNTQLDKVNEKLSDLED